MKRMGIWLLTGIMVFGSALMSMPHMEVGAEGLQMEVETEPLQWEGVETTCEAKYEENTGFRESSDMLEEVPLYTAQGGEAFLLPDAPYDKCAIVDMYPIEVIGYHDTAARAKNYYASCPEIISFFDAYGKYNVAYSFIDDVYIQRYDKDMKLVSRIQLPKSYESLGNIICDNQGNYYAVWGQSDLEKQNCVTISVIKYDYQGKIIKECAYKGYETWDDNWGTQEIVV